MILATQANEIIEILNRYSYRSPLVNREEKKESVTPVVELQMNSPVLKQFLPTYSSISY